MLFVCCFARSSFLLIVDRFGEAKSCCCCFNEFRYLVPFALFRLGKALEFVCFVLLFH